MNSKSRKKGIKDKEERRLGRIRALMENLTALRENLGLTQAELADLVGVTRSQIVNYETGRRVMSWMAFLAFVQTLGRDYETKETLYRLGILDRALESNLVRDEDLEFVRGGVRIAVFNGPNISNEALLQIIETGLRQQETPKL